MAKNKKDAEKRSNSRKNTPEPKKVSSRKPAPAPEPEFDSEEELTAVDDPAAELLDQAVRATPWWALSLAFHGIVLASLPLVVFSYKAFAVEGTPRLIQITTPKQRITMPEPSDLRRQFEQPGELTDKRPEEFVPKVYIPGATPDDHFETDNGEEFKQAKGDSLDAHSYYEGADNGIMGRKPGLGAGTNESMGVGGGSGSGKKFGGKYGGRANHFIQTSGTRYGSAVLEGLRWLARHQSPDGHWSSESFDAQCAKGHCTGHGLEEFDTGNTGLALLAFLGAGFTPQQRSFYVDPVSGQKICFGDVVRKGIKWLVDHQNADGAVGPQVGEMMYNHAIASLALSEAFGLTNAIAYKVPAQKAIGFLISAQNYGLGWRYTAKCGNNDTSVTGWCVMALKSAQISGLDISKQSYIGAKAWFDRVTDSNGQTGYDRLGSGEIYVPGKNEKWAHHPSMTAVSVLCRIFIDKNKSEKVLADGTKILMQDLPSWQPNAARPTVDFYYWYYATLALFQYDGATGANWKKWNKIIVDTLCNNQRTSKDGCLDGSWDTENVDRWAYAGGRVYGTAINVLTLETSYRYESAFGSDHRENNAAKAK